MKQLLRQSVALDLATLRLSEFRGSKVLLLMRKYTALLMVWCGLRPWIRVGPYRFQIAGIDNLGTVQSSILDFATHVYRANVLPEAPTIIDVGANIGQFCLAAKLFYPRAEVTSIEADPDVAERLVANVGNLPGVLAVQAALGESPGVLPWFRHRLSGMSSFVPYSDYLYGCPPKFRAARLSGNSTVNGAAWRGRR